MLLISWAFRASVFSWNSEGKTRHSAMRIEQRAGKGDGKCRHDAESQDSEEGIPCIGLHFERISSTFRVTIPPNSTIPAAIRYLIYRR